VVQRGDVEGGDGFVTRPTEDCGGGVDLQADGVRESYRTASFTNSLELVQGICAYVCVFLSEREKGLLFDDTG